MRTVTIAVLEEWISNGSFNLHHKPDEDCNRTTAILIILTPNSQGTGLTYASIGLIIRRHKGPVGQIEDIPRLITFIRSQLKGDWPTSPNDRKTYCMIVGDYGGPLAFATELPFCTAYPLSFSDRDDPTCEWPSAIHIIILGLSLQMFSWFVNYLHEIVLCMSTRGTDTL